MTGKFDTLIRERLMVAIIYVTAHDGGCMSTQQYHGSGVRLDQSPPEQGKHTNESITKGQRNWS